MRLLIIRLALCFLLVFSLAARAVDDEEDFLATDSTATAELEKQIAEPPPAADVPQELCIFLHKRGIAHIRLGHYDQAITDLKQALGMKQSGLPNQWCDRWRLQADIHGALHSSGDWLVLAEYVQSVSEEYKNSHKWHYFSAQLWQVDPNVYLGKLREAEQAFQRASEILPTLRQQKGWAAYGSITLERHSTYAAWMQSLRGNYVEAERFRRQALRHAQEFLDYSRANRSADHPDVRNAAGILTARKRMLAGILTTQGKTGEAEILARQALQETLSRSGKNTLVAANSLRILGNIKLQQGQIAAALRLQEIALSTLESSGIRSYSTALANLRAQIGFLFSAQNRWADALKIYEQRDQGLRGNAAQFARTGSRNINWAMALLKSQRIDEGEKMLRGMLDYNLKKPFVDPLFLAHLRGYLAVSLVAAGKKDSALAQFREAFPVLIRQAETDNDSENGGFVRQYRLRLIAEGFLELLSRLADEKSAPAGYDPVAEAFQVAEVARGSSVQQAIANSAARATLPDAALADLARREQDTANQISALNKLLIRLASASESQRLDKTITDIRSDVVRLETQHTSLRRELAERYPAYADLVAPKPPVPADIQKLLQKNEAAVTIYVAEQKTYVWTITPLRIAFRAVDVTRQQIDKQVDTLRRTFDLSSENIRPFDTLTARNLYAALLAPDAALWSDASLLNVIPHGTLGQLPFAVLLTAESSTKNSAEQPWLLKKLAIAQQPSVGTLISLRAQGRAEAKRRPFVGFGDPLFFAQTPGKAAGTRSVRNLSIAPVPDDLIEKIATGGTSRATELLPGIDASTLLRSFAQIPPLPDTADELNEIGKTLGADLKTEIFLGQRATEKNVKNNDLSAYRVVAFATHGLVPGDLRGLDQPSLALSNPSLTDDRDNDGFLTMSEVLGIKLNADWVVLSACNTASGDGKSEEAVSGLGRAFFFAGSRRLLVSYWPVETVSARLLTTELFKRQTEQPEESKAEALRHSMLKLMNSSKDYSHPAFWAPFGLIGDAAR
jgi:CHAT domain-containing protein/tetratricopeptide (TPR) repeat protein